MRLQLAAVILVPLWIITKVPSFWKETALDFRIIFQPDFFKTRTEVEIGVPKNSLSGSWIIASTNLTILPKKY